MTVTPHSTKTLAEAHASEPPDDYELDLLLAAAYDHMDWPVTRLFGADDDPAAEARREEHCRAVFAEWDRESEARAREFRERQAAERQAAEVARKPRRMSTAKLFEHAKKTGATSITLPDGTRINFSQEPSGEADIPRDASVVASDRIIELCKRGKRGA